MGDDVFAIWPAARWVARISAGGNVTREGRFLDSPVHSGLFECFQCRRLGMRESGLGAAFGEGPAAAATRAYQKKLNRSSAQPVTHRRDPLAAAQFAELCEPHESARFGLRDPTSS